MSWKSWTNLQPRPTHILFNKHINICCTCVYELHISPTLSGKLSDNNDIWFLFAITTNMLLFSWIKAAILDRYFDPSIRKDSLCTVFLWSEAVATIFYTARFCAATIRGWRLFEQIQYVHTPVLEWVRADLAVCWATSDILVLNAITWALHEEERKLSYSSLP